MHQHANKLYKAHYNKVYWWNTLPSHQQITRKRGKFVKHTIFTISASVFHSQFCHPKNNYPVTKTHKYS